MQPSTAHGVCRLPFPRTTQSTSPRRGRSPVWRPLTLSAIRRGLEQAVSDPRGTAHAALDMESIAVAGKTGTAEAGPGRAEHAWFAGYVPAGQPRVALVVVLEHAGNADETAGPVARRLVLEMDNLGYFPGRK